MPQFIDDFMRGAKITGEYLAMILLMVTVVTSSLGIVMGAIWLAKYIAGNNPILIIIVLPIQLIVMGGLGCAFYNLIPRKWSEFCKRRKKRQHLNSQKSKFQRMSKSINML